MDFGTSLPNNTQRLCPLSDAFQAEVRSGSMCMVVPDRYGPIMNLSEKESTIYGEASSFLLLV